MKAAAILNGMPPELEQCPRESRRQHSVTFLFQDVITLEAALNLHRQWLNERHPWQPDLSLWKIDSLSHQSVFEAAAEVAGDADVVVFSLHVEDDMGDLIKSWIEHWLPWQRGRNCGLVVLFTGNLPPSVAAPPSLPFFREAALSAGMRFHACSASLDDQTNFGSLAHSLDRENYLVPILKQSRAEEHAFRHGGINE